MVRQGLETLKRRVKLERGNAPGSDNLKTAVMFRLERRYGKSIYDLLKQTDETGAQLAYRLGVTQSAVSKWRKRLGIRVTNPTSYKPVVI